MVQGPDKKLVRVIQADLETAEILAEDVQYFRRKREPYESKCTFWKKEGDDRTFFNTRMENWEQFINSNAISNALVGHALYLATYMHYDNIIYHNERDKYPANAEGIAEIMGLSKRSATKILKDLQAAGLITVETKEVLDKQFTCYKLNDTYFYRGQFVKDGGKYNHTTKAFNLVIQQLYLENNAATLAFIAKMLPFLDKETNILAVNQHRDINFEALQHMKLEDAAKIAGISRQAASNIINKAKYHGIWAIAKIITGKTVRYKLNPDIATRQAGVTAFADSEMFRSIEGSYTFN